MNNPADTLAALAPCPFCGGADIRLHNTHTPKFSVECEDCGAEAHGEYFPFRGNKEKALFSYEHDSEPGIPFQTGDISKMPAAYRKAAASAIAAWNRRASLKGEAEPVGDVIRDYGPVLYCQLPPGTKLYTTPTAPQAVGEGLKVYVCDYCGSDYTDAKFCCHKRREYLNAHGKFDSTHSTPSPAPQGGWEALATDEVLVAITRGEGYEDVAPELVAEDALGLKNPFQWRVVATPPAQQPGEVGEEIAELRRNYDGAKRWLFALAMEQGGSVSVSRQALYRMRPDDKLTMMESPSGDAYRLTAALAPKEKGNG